MKTHATHSSASASQDYCGIEKFHRRPVGLSITSPSPLQAFALRAFHFYPWPGACVITKHLHKSKPFTHAANHTSILHRIGGTVLVSILLMLLTGIVAYGQQPVQVTTQLRAPYTLQLSDYYASTQEKLVVVLTNRDLNKPVLNVRLRMSIESQSVQLRSKDFALLPTLALEAGVPLRLSLNDLAPYFNADNLDFSGLTRAQYAQQARLPEGFYQFCFEAIEVSTGQVASAKSCAMAWMSLSDPPLLNVPAKGESFALKEPQNIIFQWTPRHLNSPNSAFATDYDFQLVELWDNTLAPEVAFQAMQPLYEVTTQTTTLLYGPSQPLLLPGKRYGWRIRAHAKSGVEEVDVFRNQGFSEIYWFTYQDVCPVPTGIVATPGTLGNLQLSWLAVNRHTGYMVTYRQKDKAGATWFDQQSSSASALVYDVQPGLSYEYRIGAFCNTDKPVYSDVYTVQLPPRNTSAYANCSIVPNSAIANKQALQVLKAGDVITAGDFPIKLSGVVGSGTFSGTGYVTVPFLGRAKVKVSFSNIQVNTQHQLMAGTVITLYDEDEGSIADVDEAVDIFRDYQGIVSRLLGFTADVDMNELKNVLDKLTENAEAELPLTEADQVKQNVKELLEAKEVYDYIKNTYDALPDSDDLKQSLKNDLDEASQKFDEIKSRFEGKDKDAITSEKYSVKFDICVLPESTTYGFDAFKPSKIVESNYDVKIQGTDKYFIPWKAITTGEFDWVNVYSTTLNEVLPDNITFRTSTGALTSKPILMGKGIAVKLHGYGTDAGEKSEVIAYQTKEVDGKTVNVEIGKLNVVNYPRIYKKVVLVPLNDARLPASQEAIQARLNKIYRQAVVEWKVDVKPSLVSNYDVTNDGLDDDESIIREHRYTPEMKTIIADYQRKEAMNADVQYLFIVPYSKSRYRGYNPYMKQVGFVFMEEDERTEDGFVTTMAHELGHGAFNLRHTFDNTSIPKKSTDNLMDYHGDSQLYKFQWDLIHDPGFSIPLFETDEPAAYKTWSFVDGDVISNIPGYKDVVKSFLSITGKVITLPENASDFTFSKGYLTAFTIGNERYKSFATETIPKRFIGYYSDLKQGKDSFISAGSVPYGGQPTGEHPVIFYALPVKNGACGAYEIRQAKYNLPLGSANDGGINDPAEFYLKTEISTATEMLSGDKNIAFVQEGVNCLKGRAKELFKFIEEHYASHNIVLESKDKSYLAGLIGRYSNVFIKGIDVDIDKPVDKNEDAYVKLHEMLNYGYIEFIANLSAIGGKKNLLVEFEDYHRIKDIYLYYRVFEKISDCIPGSRIQNEILKQQQEKDKVDLNADLYTAIAKTLYELHSGNSAFKVANCLIDYLKVSESHYNPNRIDKIDEKAYQTLFEMVFKMDIKEVVPAPVNYVFTCSCGVWNSAIDIVKGVPELGEGLTQSPDELIKKIHEFTQKISTLQGWRDLKEGIFTMLQQHHGYVNGYGVDSYKANYGACYDILVVASIYLGFKKLYLLAEAAQAGETGEMARMILRAAKNYPGEMSAFMEVIWLTSKLSNRDMQLIILKILEKFPEQISVSTINGTRNIVVIHPHTGVIARFSNDGIEIIVKAENVAKDAVVVYKSAEDINDITQKTSGPLVLLADKSGKIVAANIGVEIESTSTFKIVDTYRPYVAGEIAIFYDKAGGVIGILSKEIKSEDVLEYTFKYNNGREVKENVSVIDGIFTSLLNFQKENVKDLLTALLTDVENFFTKKKIKNVRTVLIDNGIDISPDLILYRKALSEKKPMDAALSTRIGQWAESLGRTRVLFPSAQDISVNAKRIVIVFKNEGEFIGEFYDVKKGTIVGQLYRDTEVMDKNRLLYYIKLPDGTTVLESSLSMTFVEGVFDGDVNLKELAGNGIGAAIFEDAANQFGIENIKKFNAIWEKSDDYAGGESVNLTVYQSGLKTMDAEDAALSTPSGRLAKRVLRFTNVMFEGDFSARAERIVVTFSQEKEDFINKFYYPDGKSIGKLYMSSTGNSNEISYTFKSFDTGLSVENKVVTLHDGILKISEIDLLQKVASSELRESFFTNLLKSFSSENLKGIEDLWVEGESLAGDLKIYRNVLEKELNLIEGPVTESMRRAVETKAALATEIGQRALKLEFDNVEFLSDHSLQSKEVKVRFTKKTTHKPVEFDPGYDPSKSGTIAAFYSEAGESIAVLYKQNRQKGESNIIEYTVKFTDPNLEPITESVSLYNGILYLNSLQLIRKVEPIALMEILFDDMTNFFGNGTIKIIRDLWDEGSLDFARYTQALSKMGGSQPAALSTPIGQIAGKLELSRFEALPQNGKQGFEVLFKKAGTLTKEFRDRNYTQLGRLLSESSLDKDKVSYFFEFPDNTLLTNLVATIDNNGVVLLPQNLNLPGALDKEVFYFHLIKDLKENQFVNRFTSVGDRWDVGNINYKAYKEAFSIDRDYENAAFATPLGKTAKENFELTTAKVTEDASGVVTVVFSKEKKGFIQRIVTNDGGKLLGKLYREGLTEINTMTYSFESTDGKKLDNLVVALDQNGRLTRSLNLVNIDDGNLEILDAVLSDAMIQYTARGKVIRSFQDTWHPGDPNHSAFLEIRKTQSDADLAATETPIGVSLANLFLFNDAETTLESGLVNVTFSRVKGDFVERVFDVNKFFIGKLYLDYNKTLNYALKPPRIKPIENHVISLDAEGIVEVSLELGLLKGGGVASHILDDANGYFDISQRAGIRSIWNTNSEDLMIYRENRKEGLSPSQAALETPTGIWASQFDFTIVDFETATDAERIVVTFKKGKPVMSPNYDPLKSGSIAELFEGSILVGSLSKIVAKNELNYTMTFTRAGIKEVVNQRLTLSNDGVITTSMNFGSMKDERFASLIRDDATAYFKDRINGFDATWTEGERGSIYPNQLNDLEQFRTMLIALDNERGAALTTFLGKWAVLLECTSINFEGEVSATDKVVKVSFRKL